MNGSSSATPASPGRSADLSSAGNGRAMWPDRSPKPQRAGPSRLLWIMVPMVYGLAAWSVWGSRFVVESAQQLVELTGIAVIVITAILLALYTRTRNIRLEKAYSAHLEQLSQHLRSLAYHDSLTELYNHRYFYEQLTHEVERAQRYGRPVSVILLDLDNFKDVNDTYGHLMGDKLLALIGQVIRDQVRGSDIASRYGGDEFAIILPDTTRTAANATAQKLAKAIATGKTNAGALSESLPLSASFGVACCPDDARSVSELLQLADDALYANKKKGSSPRPVALVP